MSAQVIEKNGKPEWAVIPFEEYQRLVELAEMAEDVRAFDEAVTTKEEYVPHEVVKRLVAGENPIRVWREHRRLTQQALAQAAGISAAYLSQLEQGVRMGKIGVLRALAQALEVDLEDFLPPTTAPR
jgi:DNA-binding XRE family transcriptional regulator